MAAADGQLRQPGCRGQAFGVRAGADIAAGLCIAADPCSATDPGDASISEAETEADAAPACSDGNAGRRAR
jgi:hypothetical protein